MKKVYAIFDSEIYEIYDAMTGESTGYTAISYDDLCELCNDMMFDLVRVEGMEDDE